MNTEANNPAVRQRIQSTTKVTRTPTPTGQVVRFEPAAPAGKSSPAATPQEEWPHKGCAPGLQHSKRGSHVLRLVAALNDWWDQCNGRGAKAVDLEAAEQ